MGPRLLSIRDSLLLCGLLAGLGGCCSAETDRRSIDELVSTALAEASARSAGAAAGATGPLPLPSVDAAMWLASYQPGVPFETAPPPLGSPPAENPGTVPPPEASRLVSEVFQETDLREAIQILATQAGVSAVIDEQVTGATSAIITDEPFEAALRKVLLPQRCVYAWRDGQCVIGVPEPESALFSLIAERIDYQPRHLSPEELAASMPERYSQYLRLVNKRNRILIEAPAELAAAILEEMERADRPVPQVVLQAMVCVLSPEARLRFGLDASQRTPVTGHGLTIADLALAGSGSPATLAGMFSDFAVTSFLLRLLAEDGYVKIRATPRVMAKDGEKAQINIARETFFSIQPNADILFRQDIQRVEAGITLDILPTVRGDTITVVIEKAEVSEDIRRQTDIVQNNQFPVINRRWVSTTVHVKDGQTIVIGGLTQNQVVDRISKIPYLGKVPWLGNLFTRIEKEEQEHEIVIFLSPKIVRTPPEGFPIEPIPADPLFVPPPPVGPALPLHEGGHSPPGA